MENQQNPTTGNQTTSTDSASGQQVKVAPFNPFLLLSTDETNNEVGALAGRFTKAFRKQFEERIDEIQTEHSCSTDEACFAVYLQNDARAILTRERVRSASDEILDLLDEVIQKDAALALNSISDIYSNVPKASRVDVGKRVRSGALDTYTMKLANKMLEKVYEHLKVKEKEWM